MTPRPPHPDDWRPNEGPQTRFLSLTCYEAMTGGAAGGGKTDMLLVDAIRYVGRGYGANHQALILRRTFPELDKNIVPRSWQLYPRLGGKYNQQAKTWTFPGGERVLFGYLEHESDVYRYQGSAYCFLAFDELTQFTETQYVYLMSRVRSAHGIPLRVRSATNPGGTGHEWVFKRFRFWLDPEHMRAAPGEVLHIAHDEAGAEIVVPKGSPRALGRCFVPAKLADNPFLARDEVYRRALDELDPVTRAQLRDGNWLVKPAAGLYFKRAWFQIVDAVHIDRNVTRVRAWDLAASKDGDWTVGVLMARLGDGTFAVLDVVRFRGTPGEVRATILRTAELDGRDVPIRLPQDPAQAGVDQADSYKRMLVGWRTVIERPTGDKVTRAEPFSSACQPVAGATMGLVRLVRGPWTEAFVQELEGFPDWQYKDQVDAAADAFRFIAARGPSVKVRLPSTGDRTTFDGGAY